MILYTQFFRSPLVVLAHENRLVPSACVSMILSETLNASSLSIMQTCPCNIVPPYIPLLNSKIGVYRCIYYFLIFLSKS